MDVSDHNLSVLRCASHTVLDYTWSFMPHRTNRQDCTHEAYSPNSHTTSMFSQIKDSVHSSSQARKAANRQNSLAK